MEGIDKLLDKLGLYDLIGVLLPGIMATFFSCLADEIIFDAGFSKYILPENIFFSNS